MTAPDSTSSDTTNTLTFLVSPTDAGERIDAFLAAKVSDWSRSRLQHLIDDGEVLVNGRVCKSSYKIKASDEIEAELNSLPLTTFAAEDIPIEVVYEDDDVIVINKSAGIVVHPAAGISSGTLANALAFHFRKLSTAAGGTRPGIVHRLDKDTSGLLVVAKTESAHENLSDQFRAREVFKSYVALVHGQFEKNTGEIDQPIGRDPRHRTRMTVVRAGRSALTLYRVRQRFDRFSLIEVELRTGRTHQIRVHLAWLKHPVVGDATYGAGRDNTVADPRIRSEIAKLNRQFLHAERLKFRHPRTKEQLSFTSQLPPELTVLLTVVAKS